MALGDWLVDQESLKRGAKMLAFHWFYGLWCFLAWQSRLFVHLHCAFVWAHCLALQEGKAPDDATGIMPGPPENYSVLNTHGRCPYAAG